MVVEGLQSEGSLTDYVGRPLLTQLACGCELVSHGRGGEFLGDDGEAAIDNTRIEYVKKSAVFEASEGADLTFQPKRRVWVGAVWIGTV